MEKIVILFIPAVLVILFIRLLAVPMRLIIRLAIHGFFGFLSLWILCSISPYTGVRIPINLITVLIAGALGAPGIGILGFLAVSGVG